MASDIDRQTDSVRWKPRVAVLTGGGDRPYALGLAAALINLKVAFDFIGSDDLISRELLGNPLVRFLNLRGDQNPKVPSLTKVKRLTLYYARLIIYAAGSRAQIFHLLWNNKLENFDRTLLTLYYKILGKRLVLTIHNVNARKRDGKDTWLNRFTLGIQYRLMDHLFVHTETMKRELLTDFNVPERKISVIPFGINSTVPDTDLTSAGARQRLGIHAGEKVLLFFGNIAPYKGLEYLIEAFALLAKPGHSYRVIVAGRPKGSEAYWESIRSRIVDAGLADSVIQKIEYVPDADTEIYFKAADLFVLPYTHIFQSGVLFLGYNFGLPVVATDVGSLREDIVEGTTGFVCEPKNPASLASCIEHFFASSLYQELPSRRVLIRSHAEERYSWTKVGIITQATYNAISPMGPA